MHKTVALVVAVTSSLLSSATAQVPQIAGEPIEGCATIMGKWRLDSRPFVEVDLTITTPACGFTVAASAIFRKSKHYAGLGYVREGVLVLPLNEGGKGAGYFLLKKRPYNLGGTVTYPGEGTHNIELWWTLKFPSEDH
jgi:hypothetical protein